MAFLAGSVLGTFVISRIFWILAWKWSNSVTKAIVLNMVSALVIIPGDYFTAIRAGEPKNLLRVALLYGGCQALVFLLDFVRVRQQARRAATQWRR